MSAGSLLTGVSVALATVMLRDMGHIPENATAPGGVLETQQMVAQAVSAVKQTGGAVALALQVTPDPVQEVKSDG